MMKDLSRFFARENFTPISTSQTSTTNKILLEDPETNTFVKVLLFPNNAFMEKEKIYHNLVYIHERLKNKPYYMGITKIRKTDNCIFIYAKKVLDLDRDRPLYRHYFTEDLIHYGILKQFFDILYDMWRENVYICDRFPSRNICVDENGQIVLIDYDIYDGGQPEYSDIEDIEFADYKSIRHIRINYPEEYTKINQWYLDNLGQSFEDFYTV